MWLSIALLVLPIASGRQPGASTALPESLREHIRTETFAPLTSVGALPDPVKRELGQLFETTGLALAEPGAPFQATDVVTNPKLPWRRLIAAGCAADHCLVHYEKGGFAHVYHVLVVSRQGDRARLVWGGAVSGPIRDVQAVRDALAAGQVLGQTKYW
jgi:hypothetical protein